MLKQSQRSTVDPKSSALDDPPTSFEHLLQVSVDFMAPFHCSYPSFL